MTDKNGIEMKTHCYGYWPLSVTVNCTRLYNVAKRHNEKNAQIEVIDPPPVKEAKPETGIKFLYNGVKIDGILYKCRYSIGPYNEASKLPVGTVTLRAKSYSTDFPKIAGAIIQNNSDPLSDYHEKDTMRIFPDSPYYKDAIAAYEKAEAKNKAQIQKKFGQAE